jgi:phosphoglycerate kinase
MIRYLKDLTELKDKKVFLRLDLNVPIKNGKILDDTRIREALPSIHFLLEQGARIVMASHMGRPKGDSAEDRAKYSLEPVAQDLAQKLKREVVLIEAPDSDAPRGLLAEAKFNKVILLENLRFDKGEEANSTALAQKWAKYCEIYINDAFGSCHRAHASIDALPRAMKLKAAGFLIEKEVQALTAVREKAEAPFVLILGGSKVSDKIAVIEKFIDRADAIIIGGAMAYTFLKAMGESVGKSLVEEKQVEYAKMLLQRMEARGKKIHLPVDHVVTTALDNTDGAKTVITIENGYLGVDIGPQTIQNFSEVVKSAKTIFWNGPMGVYETAPFNKGSFAMAKAIAESEGFSVIGGGDSAAAAVDSGYAEQVNHISTGGGASLEFMEGKTLPGLLALDIKVLPT